MLKKKKQSAIGLDIGSRTLKVAEVQETKKGYMLKRFGMGDIPTGLIEDGSIRNPEEVAEAIRSMLKIYRIKEPNVVTSIGGYSIIVKSIDVQSMPEDQLQDTITFEAEQYIPFDISDVNIDFQILGQNPNNPNMMSVLLVAAKKDMVNEYVNVLQMAKLNPTIVDLDAFALQNIYEANYDPESENVALIDIGASNTALNILRGTLSVFRRDVSLGCHQINLKIIELTGCSVDEAEHFYQDNESDRINQKDLNDIVGGVVSDWCSEIRRALDFFYSTYPDDRITKIILSGGGANIVKFQRLLAAETGTEVEVINPFRNFQIDSSFEKAYLEQVAPQAAICLGLALRRANDK